MSLEDKFNAAVNVIRSLPKSGSYQPSKDLMLTFYSYYKQATEGPCDKPKPGFWEVINRAKWDAWNSLGDMPKEEAMKQYVLQLHKIVETMSYTEDIASFLSAGDSEDGCFPTTDLELVAGDILARVRSQHNSPSESRASSPIASIQSRPRHDSEDEYIDTIDVSYYQQHVLHSDPEPSTAPLEPPVHNVQAREVQQPYVPRLSNGHANQITSQLTHLRVLEELPGTLARLERDVAALRKAVEGDRKMLQSRNTWSWPWQELSVPTMAFVVLWPFVAVRIANYWQRRRS